MATGGVSNGGALSNARAGYVLFILCVISAFNYYDRYLIGILVEDLKRDLLLSDAQVGLLSGLAFAIVYSVASLPIAAYADRGFRVRVLGAAVGFWSVMTGLCGMATGFWGMLLARFGVGIGESGGAPTTHAIVAETFGEKWRGTALSAVGVAGALGMTAAFAGGGYIASNYGWRWAFFAAALPGILIALIFILTVREPRRRDVAAGGQVAGVPMRRAVGVLLRRPAYRWTCVGVSVSAIGTFGTIAWLPAYLMRHFDLDAASVGADFSAVLGPASILATMAGGPLADWISRRDVRAPYWLLAGCFLLTGPLTCAYLLVDNYAVALALIWPAMLIGLLYTSPTYAIVQALSGPKLRATGAALFMLFVNLVGQGLGPFAIGALSDGFGGGGDGLRSALLLSAITYLAGAFAFLMAARSARADTEIAASY